MKTWFQTATGGFSFTARAGLFLALLLALFAAARARSVAGRGGADYCSAAEGYCNGLA